MPTDERALAAEFDLHRGRLIGIGYRLTGSTARRPVVGADKVAVRDDRIGEIFDVVNPDKLTHVPF